MDSHGSNQKLYTGKQWMVKPDPKSQIDYPDVNLKSLILFKPLYFIIEGPFTLSINQLGLQPIFGATHSVH